MGLCAPSFFVERVANCVEKLIFCGKEQIKSIKQQINEVNPQINRAKQQTYLHIKQIMDNQLIRSRNIKAKQKNNIMEFI